MALGGIGRDGVSPLDRFQQARDLARRKIEGDDTRNRLADLLQKKQAELGGIGAQAQGADRTSAAAAAAGAGAASPARKMEAPASAALGGLTAYGRGGATELPKAGPHLGRYIDLTA